MLRNFLLVLLSVSLTLLACEYTLRQSGYFPGFLPKYNKKFKPVNKLEVYEKFLTDDEGVFKANPEWEWKDSSISINSAGFRGSTFNQNVEENKLSILFLGDSFTWGAAAKPISNSYVDVITNHDYIAYNTGIPGTGPKQYAHLARKYVSLLKPDIIVVMFCMANDLSAPFPMRPYQNLYHITNAGWLYAFDGNGNYMQPQYAYEHYLAKSNLIIPDNTNASSAKRIIKRILLKSVIGTYIWGQGTQPRSTYKANNSSNIHQKIPMKNIVLTKSYIRKIKTLSEENNAKFMLFLIPNHPGRKQPWKEIKNTLHIFKEFNPYIPDFLQTEDYMKLPNAHFNNSGHKKYAQFIHQSIMASAQ